MISVGVLKTWDNATYTAGVQIAGSITTYLDDINVARNIDNADMVIGRQVILAILEGNPRDAVVIAVYTV